MFRKSTHDSAEPVAARSFGQARYPLGVLEKGFGTDPEFVKKLLQC
jgi:hypothetical protein